MGTQDCWYSFSVNLKLPQNRKVLNKEGRKDTVSLHALLPLSPWSWNPHRSQESCYGGLLLCSRQSAPLSLLFFV